MQIAERFAENLVRQRKASSYSQEELAYRASVHRTQISLMESGKRLPRLDTLVKLAAALEVSILKLVEGITWAPAIARDGRFEIDEP